MKITFLIVALIGGVMFGFALGQPGDQLVLALVSGVLMGLGGRLAVSA